MPRRQRKQRDDSDRKPLEIGSEKFENYYKEQGILTTDEFNAFMEFLKKPLPASFRFTGNKSFCNDLRDFMKTNLFPKVRKLMQLQGIVIDDREIQPPVSVPWYPNELCWVFDCPRAVLRKSPEVKEFQRFLVSETEVGNISRQEIVSMIPALLLDVQPSQYVLDMCAAPGSKTTQLLEAVHGDSTLFPDGLVIANDSDHARCYTLVHQAKRLQSPCLIVTNHDAQVFPRIKTGNEKTSMLQFDRILCDVPCSGDGTLRKNPEIWRKWKVADGNGLHKIQRQILHRACELVKVGGRIVYSTCSFNPLENEAVVASILAENKGAIRLLDVSSELNGLVRYPGLNSWKVSDKKGTFYSSFSETSGDLVESMFPPENASELNLDRCLRIYPFSQNSGGFFVAVLEKVESITRVDRAANKDKENMVEEEQANEAGENCNEEADQEQAKYRRLIRTPKKPRLEPNAAGTTKECPFVFVPDDTPAVKNCVDAYGLDDFPRGLFVVRTETETAEFKNIYVVSEKAKESIQSSKLRVINAGIKLFKRNGGETYEGTPYRVCSDGVNTLAPYLSEKRQLVVTLQDLVIFIKAGYPHITSFSQQLQDKINQVEVGSCLLRFDPATDETYSGALKAPIVLPFFRARVSVSLLLGKSERKSLLHRLTGEQCDTFEGLTGHQAD